MASWHHQSHRLPCGEVLGAESGLGLALGAASSIRPRFWAQGVFWGHFSPTAGVSWLSASFEPRLDHDLESVRVYRYRGDGTGVGQWLQHLLTSYEKLAPLAPEGVTFGGGGFS